MRVGHPHPVISQITLLLSVLLMAFLLIGCQNTPAPASYAAPSFSSLPKLSFNVAKVEVDEEYNSPMRTPNVEHLFPTTPAQAVHIWVNDRIQATGSGGQMLFIIKDASVVETALPVKKGVEGAFTNEQASRYDAKLIVEARIYSQDQAVSTASTDVTITLSRTLPENATLEQHDRLFNEMTNTMMQMFNQQMEQNMGSYFGNYRAY